MSTEPLASKQELESAWRALRPNETTKADWWIKAASRRIRSRWPDVDARIEAGSLNRLDVADAVIAMVVRVLTSPENPDVVSWSRAAGAESRSETLGRTASYLPIDDWIVEIFEGIKSASNTPLGSFPMMPPRNNIFIQEERYW